MPPSHFSLLPLLYNAKIIKNYSICFIFAFREHQKCIFKASGEAKLQTSPTMVTPTINTYVENKILAPIFQKTQRTLILTR